MGNAISSPSDRRPILDLLGPLVVRNKPNATEVQVDPIVDDFEQVSLSSPTSHVKSIEGQTNDKAEQKIERATPAVQLQSCETHLSSEFRISPYLMNDDSFQTMLMNLSCMLNHNASKMVVLEDRMDVELNNKVRIAVLKSAAKCGLLVVVTAPGSLSEFPCAAESMDLVKSFLLNSSNWERSTEHGDEQLSLKVEHATAQVAPNRQAPRAENKELIHNQTQNLLLAIKQKQLNIIQVVPGKPVGSCVSAHAVAVADRERTRSTTGGVERQSTIKTAPSTISTAPNADAETETRKESNLMGLQGMLVSLVRPHLSQEDNELLACIGQGLVLIFKKGAHGLENESTTEAAREHLHQGAEEQEQCEDSLGPAVTISPAEIAEVIGYIPGLRQALSSPELQSAGMCWESNVTTQEQSVKGLPEEQPGDGGRDVRGRNRSASDSPRPMCTVEATMGRCNRNKCRFTHAKPHGRAGYTDRTGEAARSLSPVQTTAVLAADNKLPEGPATALTTDNVAVQCGAFAPGESGSTSEVTVVGPQMSQFVAPKRRLSYEQKSLYGASYFSGAAPCGALLSPKADCDDAAPTAGWASWLWPPAKGCARDTVKCTATAGITLSPKQVDAQSPAPVLCGSTCTADLHGNGCALPTKKERCRVEMELGHCNRNRCRFAHFNDGNSAAGAVAAKAGAAVVADQRESAREW